MDKKNEKQKKPPKPWSAPKDKLKKYPPALTDRQKAEGRASKKPKPQELNRMLGERGTDTRAPSNSVEGLQTVLEQATMTKVLDVSATLQSKAISNMSLGIVLRALKMGLAENTKDDETNPYFMYRYLTDAFNTALTGTIPALQQAPVWFWEIIYAIKPKQTNFKTSEIKYSWSIVDSGVDESSPIPMQIGDNAYSICLTAGVIAGNVLSFPLLAPVAATDYTPAKGEKAIANLWSYVRGSKAMTTLKADPGQSAYTAGDTSAFAVVYPEIGSSYWTQGAYRNTIYSERALEMPLFAKFAQYQPVGTVNWRGWHKASASAGSSCYIGPRLSEMMHLSAISNKVIPVIKAYNFDEFFEVLSLTLAQACSDKIHNNTTTIQPCPISPLEAQILLRQTMIPLFSNEMTQDLILGGDNTDDLIPFSVGQNGVSQGVPMLLPTGLAECIRCCKRSLHQLRGQGASSRQVDYLPVLARPKSRKQLGNYKVDSQFFSELYKTGTDNNLVNLVDLSSVQGNQTVYLDVSRTQIADLCILWNEWITQLNANLTPLVTLGQADGISILKTHSYTNYCNVQQAAAPPPVTAGTAMKKQVSHKEINIRGTERKKVSLLGPSEYGYFDNLADVQTSSTLVVYAPVWKVLSMWILPVSIADPSSLNEAGRQGWKSFYIEPYTVPRSNAGGIAVQSDLLSAPSSYTRHVNMAAIDVKSSATDGQNEIIEFIIEAAKQGRGGLLETIAELAGPVVKVAGSIFGF